MQLHLIDKALPIKCQLLDYTPRSTMHCASYNTSRFYQRQLVSKFTKEFIEKKRYLWIENMKLRIGWTQRCKWWILSLGKSETITKGV